MKRLLIMLLLAASAGAPAQTFPSKPMRIIVGFPPGGPADALGRVLAQGFSESIGQSVDRKSVV